MNETTLTGGEFFQALHKRPGFKGQGADPRLVVDGPGLTSSEGGGTEGGFAAPPDVRATIEDGIAGPGTILGRCTLIPSARGQVTLPASVAAPWDTTKGIQVAWEDEGVQLTASKVALEGRVLKARKISCLVPVTDEVLEDAPALDAYVKAEAPKRFDYTIGKEIIHGNGVGRPLGLLAARSKITVSAEGGQAAATFNVTNAQQMVGRLHAPSLERCSFLMNPDVYQQVQTFTYPAFAPAGVSGYAWPTLLGIPILQHEACAALGTEGDVILADLGSYLTIRKVRQAFSVHVFFDFDVGAYKFTVRIGGLPLWEETVTPPNSAVTRSAIVTLATRS